MILVSVIIPFFKNIQWLIEAIESVKAQTLDNYEIIVINDGSLEDEKNFLENYLSSIVYRKVTNKGPAAARNLGIQLARGKFVAFLDSDDLWVPHKLESQVELMERKSLVWSHTSYSVFNNDNKDDVSLIDVSGFFGRIFPQCLYIMNIGTPCVMIRTEYLQNNEHIRFSEKMRYGEDSYLWILLAIENELGVCKESLTNVRRTGTNAVQQARIHLKVKAGLYINLIKRRGEFYPPIEVNLLSHMAYKYCYFCDTLIQKLELRLGNRKNIAIELISKVIYLPAYVFYKAGYSIMKLA